MNNRAQSRLLPALQILLLCIIFGSLVCLRFSLLPWRAALMAVAGASFIMSTVGFFSLLFIYLRFRRGDKGDNRNAVVAVLLSLLPMGAILVLGIKGKDVPPIHDITTDTLNPPVFSQLKAERKEDENAMSYGGAAVARQQQQAYPDIQPFLSETAPSQIYGICLKIADHMGWEVVSQDAEAGLIEAVAITSILAFKDDVIIRISPWEQGSRVDIRSASRIGVSDFGANASRISTFLAKVQAEVGE